MGFFSRGSGPPTRSAVPPLGSGRRLHTALSEADCLDLLRKLLLGYRTPKYAYLPPYVYPGWTWNGEPEEAFRRAICFDDAEDDFLFTGFRPEGQGTAVGMFPLGGGDDRLNGLSIIGHWKQRDPSLSSTGLFPSRLVTLRAPVLSPTLYERTVIDAGFPATPVNTTIVAGQFHTMFLIKAGEFIGRLAGQREVDRFIGTHPWAPGLEATQSVLDDLVALDSSIVPYIQELPMRCRAIMLEGDLRGTFWDQMER